MKLSLFGRWSMALFASLTLGLGMTACGGGTIGYMWVLGQEYNQIAGFKIDDYTGNLTQIIGTPFSSNGAIPVSLVVKPGGRYVYVLNQGTCPAAGCGKGQNTSSGVSVFSVGGDGTLVYQLGYQTQGYDSQWIQMDQTGSYVYVLDKYAPSYIAPNTPGYPALGGFIGPNTSGTGAITVFSADPNTGRLTLITNSQNLLNGVNTPFWTVGPTPFMLKSTSNCLFSLNSNQTVSAYSISANQLVQPGTTGTQQLTTVNATSISGGTNSSLVVITDNQAVGGGVGTTPGTIQLKSVGANCLLSPAGSSTTTANITGTFNPVYALVDTTGKYLYVLNSATTNTQTSNAYSTISAFTINSTTSQLVAISGAPYTVGSGPVCMVEDPTNQYMYSSNFNDGTVTGKVLDPTTGILSSLARGSTFTSVGHGGCLALSGSVG
jgi:6-phosphogluconolactonase (cycloisomerase 2 family)